MFKTPKTLIALSLITALSACGQKTAESHVEQAEQYVAENNINSAIIEFKNAISQSPNDGKIRYQLSQAYFAVGQLALAEKELEKSLELNYAQEQSTELLSLIKLLQYKYEDIVLLNADKTDLTGTQRLHQAIALLGMGEQDQALTLLQDLTAQQEETAQYYIAAAYISAINSNIAAAKTALAQALQIEPQRYEAQKLQAQLLAASDNLADSIALYESLVSRFPQDYQSRLNLAKAHLKNKDLQSAEQVTDSLLKRFPENPVLNQIKGTVAYSNENFADAKLHIEKAIQNELRSPSNMLIAGLINYKDRNYEQAYNYLKPIESDLADNPAFTKLLLVIEMLLGYENDAYNRLSDIDINSAEDEEFLTRASLLFMQKGNKQAVQNNLEKLANSQSDNANFNLSLGLLKLYSDDLTGLVNIEKAFADSPTTDETVSILFSAYIETEKFQEALDLALSGIEKEPSSAINYNLAAVAYSKLSQTDKADEMQQQALKVAPDNIPAQLYFLNQSIAENKLQQAKEQANNILERHPTHLITLNTLLNIERSLNQPLESSAIIKRAFEQHTELEQYKLLFAKSLFLTGAYQELIELLDQGNNQAVASNNRILWGYLIMSYKLTGQLAKAESTASNWTVKHPQDYYSWLYLLDVLEQNNDFKTGLIKSNTANNLHPDVEQFELLKVYFTLFSGDIAQAEKLFSAVSSDMKKLPLAINIKGNIQAAKGNYKAAIPLLLESYEKIQSYKIAKQIFLAYGKDNDMAKATAFMQEHLQKVPNDIGGRLQLANYYLQTNQQDKAIQHYTLLVEIAPSAFALNNLAWLQLEQKNVKVADQHIAKALQLAPNNVDVLDTAASIALAQNNVEKAKSLLNKALLQQPNNRAIQTKLNKL